MILLKNFSSSLRCNAIPSLAWKSFSFVREFVSYGTSEIIKVRVSAHFSFMMSQKWKRIKEVKSAFSRAKNSDQYIVLSISIWYIKCYNEQCWFIIARVLQRLFYKKKTLYLWIDLFYKVLKLYLLDFKIFLK